MANWLMATYIKLPLWLADLFINEASCDDIIAACQEIRWTTPHRYHVLLCFAIYYERNDLVRRIVAARHYDPYHEIKPLITAVQLGNDEVVRILTNSVISLDDEGYGIIKNDSLILHRTSALDIILKKDDYILLGLLSHTYVWDIRPFNKRANQYRAELCLQNVVDSQSRQSVMYHSQNQNAIRFLALRESPLTRALHMSNYCRGTVTLLQQESVIILWRELHRLNAPRNIFLTQSNLDTIINLAGNELIHDHELRERIILDCCDIALSDMRLIPESTLMIFIERVVDLVRYSNQDNIESLQLPGGMMSVYYNILHLFFQHGNMEGAEYVFPYFLSQISSVVTSSDSLHSVMESYIRDLFGILLAYGCGHYLLGDFIWPDNYYTLFSSRRIHTLAVLAEVEHDFVSMMPNRVFFMYAAATRQRYIRLYDIQRHSTRQNYYERRLERGLVLVYDLSEPRPLVEIIRLWLYTNAPDLIYNLDGLIIPTSIRNYLSFHLRPLPSVQD